MKKLLSLSTAVSLLIPFTMFAAPAATKAKAEKAAAPAVQTAKPVAKPAAKAEVKPVAKPAAKAEVKPVAKPAAKAEAKPVAKPAAKAEAKPVAKPAAKAEVKQTAKPVAKAEEKKDKFKIPAPAKADPAFTTNEKVELPEKKAPQPVKYRKSKPVRFLMITSNYPTARFLADEARKQAGCTIIVVPEELPFPERGTLLTVIPARADDAFSIRAEHLSRFLAYLRPLNIIMLGNDKILPPFYRPALPSFCNVINITDTAWHVNAQMLDNIFNTNQDLYKSYSRYNYQRKLQREQVNAEARRRAAEKAAAEVRASQQNQAIDER